MIRYFSLIIILSVVFVFGFTSFKNQESMKREIWLKPKYSQLTKDVKREMDCLTNNIYFESLSEPIEGKVAVAFVTLNRVKSEDFPNSICAVVTQKTHNNRVCQFSWYCMDKFRRQYSHHLLTNNAGPLYNEIMDIAIYVYANYEKMSDPTNGSIYYHADYVNPRWKNVKKETVIGRHIFYTSKENVYGI